MSRERSGVRRVEGGRKCATNPDLCSLEGWTSGSWDIPASDRLMGWHFPNRPTGPKLAGSVEETTLKLMVTCHYNIAMG